MFQKRIVLVALVMASVFIPFISRALRSLPLSSSPFQLPIASGLTAFVSQGNNSPYDHRGKQAWAFDFTVGQTNFVVTAAQSGMIIAANDSSNIQCSNVNTEIAPQQKSLPNCWTYANYILIADDDGTTASLYMHLLTNSLKVSANMHVNQGDPLGLAGTTGWSTGVHLHFQVENIPQQTQSPGWWWTQSVPVSFANPEVLAQEANGVPQAGQSFLVTSNPTQPSVPTTQPTTPTLVYVGETWTGQSYNLGHTVDGTMTLIIQSVQPDGQGGGHFTGSLSFGNGPTDMVNGTMGTSLSTFATFDQGNLQSAMTNWGITAPQLYIVMTGNFQNEFDAVEGPNSELFGETISTYDTPFDLKKVS